MGVRYSPVLAFLGVLRTWNMAFMVKMWSTTVRQPQAVFQMCVAPVEWMLHQYCINERLRENSPRKPVRNAPQLGKSRLN